MTEALHIHPYNESYVQITGEIGLLKELSEYFTFEAPNAKWSPAYQNKMWDGKIRLFHTINNTIFKGLLPYIEKFCKDREYDINVDEIPERNQDVTGQEIDDFLKNLNLAIKPRDYQETAITHAIRSNRCVFLSPTSSGKSLIMYALVRWYLERTDDKILICVPTIDLVNQLTQEFIDYCPSYPIDNDIHKIWEGAAKQSEKRIYISTWQSIYKLPKKYFNQFGTIICDEAHTMKAESIKGIFEKSLTTKYRFGLTGTLDNEQCHRLVIEGLTGPVLKVTTTKELMDRGTVSDLTIKCLILNYPDEVKKANKGFDYQQEMDFIMSYEKRSRIIATLADTIKNENVLILTNYRDHIEALKYEIEKISKKKLYIITGDTDPDERKRIRILADKENDIILLATYGVYSTGINIKNLQHVMFASGSKSLIRVPQSIGRGLRTDGKLNKVTVWDIVDNFSWKKRNNALVRHFFERIKIYSKEKFKYKLTNINI